MTHDELVWDLAKSFDLYNNSVFVEAKLGSHWMERGVPIPDVLIFKNSYTKPNTRIYEVKRTNADLQGDVRKNKFEKYLDYCDRFYFALGPDITCDWKTLLAGHSCGVLKRGNNGWRTVKSAPKLERKPLDEWVFTSLIMHGKKVDWSQRLIGKEKLREKLLTEEIKDLTHGVLGRIRIEAQALEDEKSKLEKMADAAEAEAMKRLRDRLGLPENNRRWRKDTIEEILNDLIINPVKQLISEKSKVFKELEEK